jgi:hypothetical protein
MEKKFDNVFELLAEAKRTDTPIEKSAFTGSEQVWAEDTFLGSRNLNALRIMFQAGKLRLKPKTKKTVEGWGVIHPQRTSNENYIAYTIQTRLYSSEYAARTHTDSVDTIAKITFEVEE